MKMKPRTRKNKLMHGMAAALVGAAMLASCDVSMLPESLQAQRMRLDRHDITLMVGDSCQLNMVFEPDSVTNPTAYWVVDGYSAIVEDENGIVKGCDPGDSQVRCIALNGLLKDTCQVHVMPRWDAFDHTPYEYDMVVYADVDIKGHRNDSTVSIGAFYSDNLRGYGRVMCRNGEPVCTVIRVYHTRPFRGTFTFHYYLPKDYETGECDYTIEFDGEYHGTPSNPIKITVGDEE